MQLLKVHSWKGLLIHLAIMLVLGISAALLFFNAYLPATTNHGETVTVPDLEGLHEGEINDFLSQGNRKPRTTHPGDWKSFLENGKPQTTNHTPKGV